MASAGAVGCGGGGGGGEESVGGGEGEGASRIDLRSSFGFKAKMTAKPEGGGWGGVGKNGQTRIVTPNLSKTEGSTRFRWQMIIMGERWNCVQEISFAGLRNSNKPNRFR